MEVGYAAPKVQKTYFMVFIWRRHLGARMDECTSLNYSRSMGPDASVDCFAVAYSFGDRGSDLPRRDEGTRRRGDEQYLRGVVARERVVGCASLSRVS